MKDPSLMVLYGPTKVGKTTILSKLENNLIIDMEDGTKYISAMKVKANSLEDLKEIREKVKEAGNPYTFLTFDPATQFEELVKPLAKKHYMATPQGKNFDPNQDILTLPKGSGYYWLRIAFMEVLGKFRELADHVILVGHLKTTSVEKDGKEVDAKELDLTGKIKTLVGQEADAVGYIYRGEEDTLNVSFKAKESLVCGARPEHLKGQDIKLADYDPDQNDLINVNWDQIFTQAYS